MTRRSFWCYLHSG